MTDEPGEPNPSGEVRASDAEREAVVERLRVATVEGRLTLGELTERTEAAYPATTRSELVPITADLPAVSDSPATPARPTGRGDREWVVAVMGDSKRQGRWRVERSLAALAIMGDVMLDLRGAEVPQGEVDITATARHGRHQDLCPRRRGRAAERDRGDGRQEGPGAGSTGRPGSPQGGGQGQVVMGDVKVLGDSSAELARRTLRAWLTGDDRDRRAIE